MSLIKDIAIIEFINNSDPSGYIYIPAKGVSYSEDCRELISGSPNFIYLTNNDQPFLDKLSFPYQNVKNSSFLGVSMSDLMSELGLIAANRQNRMEIYCLFVSKLLGYLKSIIPDVDYTKHHIHEGMENYIKSTPFYSGDSFDIINHSIQDFTYYTPNRDAEFHEVKVLIPRGQLLLAISRGVYSSSSIKSIRTNNMAPAELHNELSNLPHSCYLYVEFEVPLKDFPDEHKIDDHRINKESGAVLSYIEYVNLRHYAHNVVYIYYSDTTTLTERDVHSRDISIMAFKETLVRTSLFNNILARIIMNALCIKYNINEKKYDEVSSRASVAINKLRWLSYDFASNIESDDIKISYIGDGYIKVYVRLGLEYDFIRRSAKNGLYLPLSFTRRYPVYLCESDWGGNRIDFHLANCIYRGDLDLCLKISNIFHNPSKENLDDFKAHLLSEDDSVYL